jgi:prepilin-type N-terminal cleavage/methylation domain-containing protein
MMQNIQKKAFTLLEVTLVIVILGIVASVASTIISQLYENYMIQRAMHNVSLKTELAINQIVNRLTYRIENSVIARKSDGTFIPLQAIEYGVTNTDNAILEWIGYDNESFEARNTPGWSGYCDVTATAAPNILTPGSNLNFTSTVIGNLSNGNPTLALLFSLGDRRDGNITNPDSHCFGYNGDASCIHQSGIVNNTTLSTNRASGTASISDQYKLAWSAYAIVPVNANALYNDVRNGAIVAEGIPQSFDLELRYNYQPWAGSQYTDASHSTLIRNATSFKFSEQGGTIRVKLCATERTAFGTNVSVCKEKVVIR